MMIFIREKKVDKEEAQQVLDFFRQHPERESCTVGYDRGETFTGNWSDTFTYTRADIPQLERVVNEQSERPTT